MDLVARLRSPARPEGVEGLSGAKPFDRLRASGLKLHPAPAGLALDRVRDGWPGPGQRRDASGDAAVARQFEALIVQSLLKSARAAKLGDDGLGETGDTVRDMQDRQRAEAIASAAPLGIARLLAREK